MTTPENFRRRQRIEAVLLIIVGIGMIVQAIYFNHEDQKQKQCLADQFQRLTTSYSARARLAEKDSQATNAVIMAVATAKNRSDYVDALQTFVGEQARISQARKDHPVPPFPAGKCQ